MKKHSRLPISLDRPAKLSQPGKGTAPFEFYTRSPVAENAQGLQSKERTTRAQAIARLSDMASDKRSRIDAVEAIRELGRAAREHESEVSTGFIEKMDAETLNDANAATARANNALLAAGFGLAAGLGAIGAAIGSVPISLFAFAGMGALISRLLVSGPAANVIRMTRSSAWDILEAHEKRELERKANE